MKQPKPCWCTILDGSDRPTTVHPSRALALKFVRAWFNPGTFRVVRYLPAPSNPPAKKRKGGR